MGLEGPLAWLADQLEAVDREVLDWLWDLVPDTCQGFLGVFALSNADTRSDAAIDFRRRLNRRYGAGLRPSFTVAASLAIVTATAAGYDAWGYRDAVKYEQASRSAPSVEWRRSRLLAWHPTLPLVLPRPGLEARCKLQEWRIKAAEVRVATGTAGPDVASELRSIKEQSPDLVMQISAWKPPRTRPGRRPNGPPARSGPDRD